MNAGKGADGLPPEVREAAAGLEAILGPATPTAVACGIVVRTWREALEGHHGLLSDAEMAWTNIATTQAVLPYCGMHGVDWSRARRALVDPAREVLPGRSVSDVLGAAWPDVRTSLTRLMDLVEVYPVGVLASFAALMCPDWWGMPGWPGRVAEAVSSGRVSRWTRSVVVLTETLIDDPTQLDFDVWEQVLQELSD